MSEMDSSGGIASGTAQIIEHMTPGARPGSREPDGREAGDIERARAGVDLLFASIGGRLCPDGALLAPSRDRLLYNAVEYLRSHVARLEARVNGRLDPRRQERQNEADRVADIDPAEEEFLLAEQAEGIQRQIDVMRAALYHALIRFGEVFDRPWLVRHDSLDMQGSGLGLGAQIDADAFFEARDLWQPAPDTLTRVREAMEEQAEKRARLRAAAIGREAPEPLAELLPAGDGSNEDMAAAVAQTFQTLSLVYPDGTQLQDERGAGAWRLVRLFDSAAEQTSVDAMKRMPDHPALQPDSDAEASASFDDESRAVMLRIEMLARAADAAGALYLETTGEEWARRDVAMTAAAGPRSPAHAGLTGEHYTATHRAAHLGHPSPLPLDGPHIVIAGGGELDPDANRDTVEAVLTRLHERIPGMVLHYGARLQDPGGKPRRLGVDPIVRRWATARGVPLIPHPPQWDEDNGRYDIHGRDDGWVAMRPDLVFDFGGGNAHQRFLALSGRNRIPVRDMSALLPAQAQEIHAPASGQSIGAIPDDTGPGSGWLGLIVDARRLFQASQDGWLRPRADAGILLGQDSFVSEDRSATSGFIPVRLTFDPELIPFPDAWRDLEQGATTTREASDIATVRWRAPLPMSAVTRIEVASEDDKRRLVAMADPLSDFSLPATAIQVSHAPVNPPTAHIPRASRMHSLELSDDINSIQGAMTMAAWAAPDTEPWTELLNSALEGDAAAAGAAAAGLDAHWLEFPWLSYEDAGSPASPPDDQQRLWRAAVTCMQWNDDDNVTSAEMAKRIAAAAAVDGPNPAAEAWRGRTLRLLDHEERLSTRESPDDGPGLAIQLALLQPGPVGFRTWPTSLPDLPAPVWCGAAALCGWRRGFRLLPSAVRGTPEFQKLLPGRALAASWPDGAPALPPDGRLATAEENPVERPLVWAGIGSRGNDKEPMPRSVLADMTELARRMAEAGWHLSSGGADGSDTAFANGTPVDQRTIWLPWPGYNDLSGPDCHPIPRDRLQQALELAERFHPTWHTCKPSVRKLHARNGLILLGRDLDRPVDAVVAYTQDGKLQGGTAQGLRIARKLGIPIFNLGSMTMEQAWEKLQALQRRPPAMRTASETASRLREPDAEQWRAFRRDRALSRVRGMLRDFDITTLPRDVLAELHNTREADRIDDGRLHTLSLDQLLDGLDRLQTQIESLREDMPADGSTTPEGRETSMRMAAMEEAADRFHTVLADKTIAAMREEDSPDAGIYVKDIQKHTLDVMLSVWRLAREGPLATESNRLVREAAKAFASQHSRLDKVLAAETRERSGLGLDHAPGSAEETAALARGAVDADDGEAFEYMLSDAERQEKDSDYLALAARTHRLDVMARTAQTFAEAVRVDMRRDFSERDRLRTQHLDGAETPDAVRERTRELQAAHGQLLDGIFSKLEALCPADHVSGEDRDRLMSRFAGIFSKLDLEFDADIMHTVRTGKGADRFRRQQAAAAHLRILAGHAGKAVAARTGYRPHAETSPKTQNAGEWLMERLRRARDRRKAETLAPEGWHVAIVGGRALGEDHSHRIAGLLNVERARNPERPLVLHCIEQEGAGLHAARWAAMHGVACVTHRPKRYTMPYLRKRDARLLDVPLESLWNFGADSNRDRAAHMLIEAAAKTDPPIEIRNMQPDPDGLFVSEAVIDPPLAVEREFDRIYSAWDEAEKAAGDGALIYRPGMEELRPDIDRIVASPHLTGAERNFLTDFKAVLDSENRVRAEIDSAIERGRNHLAEYEALMERRGPHAQGTVLFDTDPDYRKWELHAGQIAKTFENWFAIDDAGHRDHVDRRRLDLTDIAAEIGAIRKSARSARLAPHRVDIPLEAEPGPVDQRFDPKHCSGLMDRALLPEDERDLRAVAELARWSRAWTKETLGLFKTYVEDAEQAGQAISTHRLAFGLSPALAAGMSQISEEIWAREAAAIGQRQAVRERGRGMSA